MEKIFLPGGFIATFFVVLWLVQYPGEVWQMMTMRGGTRTDKAVGACMWVFVMSAVMTVVWVCDKLT